MSTQINPLAISPRFYNFDQLIAMCKSMKACHYFYADAESRFLYGVNETPSGLRVLKIPDIIDLPFSIYFKLSNIDIDLVNACKSFDYDENGLHSFIGDQYVAIDLRPRDSSEYIMQSKLVELVINFRKASQCISMTPSIFGDMENHPVVQEVVNNKVTEGARYLRLTGMNGKDYGFMIWRNLFSLNKGDKLTIYIWDRLDDPKQFQVKFLVDKKKSPIPHVIPQYIEQTYAMYINI